MTSRPGKFARGGAAAFAVGLFLAGPQPAVAGADSGSDASPAAPSTRGSQASPSARSSQAAPSARGVLRGSPPTDRGTAPAAARAPRSAAALAGPARRVAVNSPVANVVAPPVEVPFTLADGRVAAAVAPVVATPLGNAATGPRSARVARTAALQRLAPRRVTAPPTAAAPGDKIDSFVRRAFNSVEHRLFDLPASPLVNFAEGALLLVRRNLFNQAPRVTPSQQSTAADGTIGGRIGAVDLEGDTLTYTVVGDPNSGTVTVDADGVYTYTAKAGFTGTDSFTVKIAPEKRSLDLTNLRSDGSREVTIQIGGKNHVDPPDAAVYLADASGHLTVKKNLFNQFTGTLSLTNLTPDTQLRWLDTEGRYGTVTLDALASVYWPEFQAKAADNGATANLAVSYTGADGAQNTVLLEKVQVTNDAGKYVFTGHLAPDPALDPHGVDRWDVVGKQRKAFYENFRTTYNIEKGLTSQFRTVDIDVIGAQILADTYTPLSYQQSGMYSLLSPAETNPKTTNSVLAASESSTGALNGAAANPASAPTGVESYADVSSGAAVTASIASGTSVIVGRADGSVEVWTGGKLHVLKDNQWGASVVKILEYDRPLPDAQSGTMLASNFTGYIKDTTLTVTGVGLGATVKVGSEITGAGIATGTTITKFVEQQCQEGLCTQSDNTGTNGGPGVYEVSISQTVGMGTYPAGIEITQPDVPATSPAFVVGLDDGSVHLWSPTTDWVDLHDEGWAAGVTAMINYGDSIVVGLGNGSVQQWSGKISKDNSAGKLSGQTNWTELKNDTWGAEVTALVGYRNGFLASLGGLGGVQYWDGSGWTEVHDSSWKSSVNSMIAYKDGVVVGLAKGAVEYWSGTARPSEYSTLDKGKELGFTSSSQAGALTSPNGVYTLRLEQGGNLVLYGGGKAVWNTRSETSDANRLVMQSDGNLVLYKDSTKVWSTGTGTTKNPAVKLSVNDDGNVVLYRADGSVAWASQTSDQNGASGKYKEPNPRPNPLSNNWTELQGAGWNSAVTALMPYKGRPDVCAEGCDGFLVGLANGAVEQFSEARYGAGAQGWWERQGAGWASGVKTMVSFGSDAAGLPLFMVGLANGSVQKWDGTGFTEVHGAAWDSAVITLLPIQSFTSVNNSFVGLNGVVAGLKSGALMQWIDSPTRPSDVSVLQKDQYLAINLDGQAGNRGAVLTSSNGSYALYMQPDGNVVLYGGGDKLWATNTADKNGDTLYLQSDGNLKLFNSATGDTVWQTGTDYNGANGQVFTNTDTAGNPATHLELQDDGNLVLYSDNGKPVWSIAMPHILTAGDWSSFSLLPKYPTDNARGLDGQRKTGSADGPIKLLSKTPDPIANNWVPLSNAYNVAQQIIKQNGPLQCDKWNCSNPGTIVDGIKYVTQTLGLQFGGSSGFPNAAFGAASGGVGAADDPIFSDQRLWPKAEFLSNGTVMPIALNIPHVMKSYLSWNYPATYSFKAEFNCGTACSDDSRTFTMMLEKPLIDDKKNKVDLTGWNITTNAGAAGSDPFTVTKQISDLAYEVTNPGTQAVTSGKYVNVTSSSPSKVSVGVDINLIGYGYVAYGDNLQDLLGGGSSVALFAGLQVGPAAELKLNNGAVSSPVFNLGEKTAAIWPPYVYASAGANANASFTLNGNADLKTIGANAYVDGGLLIAHNTQGTSGSTQFGGDFAFELGAGTLYDALFNSTGATATVTINPNANIQAGIITPSSWRALGGVSLFDLKLGVEAPHSWSVCADRAGNCPATGNNVVSSFYGLINTGDSGTAGSPLLQKSSTSLTNLYAQLGNGNTLTVLVPPLFGGGSPATFQTDSVVSGPGVTAGTKITAYLGRNCVYDCGADPGVTTDDGPAAIYADQYRVSKSQSAIGGGTVNYTFGYLGNVDLPELKVYAAGNDASFSTTQSALMTIHGGVMDWVPLLGNFTQFNMKIPVAYGNVVRGLDLPFVGV